MKTIITFIQAIFAIFIIMSCNINSKIPDNKCNIQRFSKKAESFYVEYKIDTIFFKNAKDSPAYKQWFYKEGRWYDCIDSTLCMALNDTVIYYEKKMGEFKYKREIKQINDNEYCCIESEITLAECREDNNSIDVIGRGIILIAYYYYDKHYMINKILKQTEIVHTVDSCFSDFK